MSNRYHDHPERRKGEVFVGNFSYENVWGADHVESTWKYQRKGSFAYDVQGNAINGHYPLFASAIELNRAIKRDKGIGWDRKMVEAVRISMRVNRSRVSGQFRQLTETDHKIIDLFNEKNAAIIANLTGDLKV